jgi:hypothetical protein
MFNNFFLLLFFLYLPYIGNAQNQNLRKAILKSDLIFLSDAHSYKKTATNDYSKQNYIFIDKIDTILKSNLSSLPKKLTLINFEDGEDFYSDLLTNGGGCIQNAKMYDIYSFDLFFVQKVGKEYRILAFFSGIESKQYDIYKKQILTIKDLEQTKDVKLRFEKTLDWFIENGLTPDTDFVDYYKSKQITTDTINYSEKQYQKALLQFEKGEEGLLPIVKDKYSEAVQNYFLNKLEIIAAKNERDYNDYFEFYQIVNRATDYFGDDGYNSIEYLLNNNLTSDKIDEYDKEKIMNYLIQTVKDWK